MKLSLITGLTQNNSSSSHSSQPKPKIEHKNDSRPRRRSSGEANSAPKRFRPDPLTPAPPVDDEDDIQEVEEVVPVKAEPIAPTILTPSDPGTMAMYEDETSGGTMMMDENNFDEYGQDYDQDEYTEQNFMVAGQDGSSGRTRHNLIRTKNVYSHKTGYKQGLPQHMYLCSYW